MTEQTEHDDPPMSLVAHLTELRDRLLRAVLAVLVGFIILFPFANEIYEFGKNNWHFNSWFIKCYH